MTPAPAGSLQAAQARRAWPETWRPSALGGVFFLLSKAMDLRIVRIRCCYLVDFSGGFQLLKIGIG